MLKLFRVLMMFAIAGFLFGCAEFKEMFREAMDPDAYASEDPNSEDYRPRFVVGVFTIVKYPRASSLERDIQTLDGRKIWINTNQDFSSKNIKEVEVVSRPGNPDVCDLRFRIDRHGRLQWQVMAGTHIDEPLALVIDGVYYGSFIAENPASERDEWVVVRAGINPVTAKGVQKFAPRNYTYYNPDTASWF